MEVFHETFTKVNRVQLFEFSKVWNTRACLATVYQTEHKSVDSEGSVHFNGLFLAIQIENDNMYKFLFLYPNFVDHCTLFNETNPVGIIQKIIFRRYYLLIQLPWSNSPGFGYLSNLLSEIFKFIFSHFSLRRALLSIFWAMFLGNTLERLQMLRFFGF